MRSAVDLAADLSADEVTVIREMNGEWAWFARALTERTGLALADLRAARLALRNRRLAEIRCVFSEDDGMANGSGYFLTPLGERVRDLVTPR